MQHVQGHLKNKKYKLYNVLHKYILVTPHSNNYCVVLTTYIYPDKLIEGQKYHKNEFTALPNHKNITEVTLKL